jgi:hypothetical protein
VSFLKIRKTPLIVLRLSEQLVREFLAETEAKAPTASTVRLVGTD